MTRERHLLDGGIAVNTVRTDKLKTEYISVNFLIPLERRTLTAVNLLRCILLRGCDKYPTLEALSARLDELYGAELASECRIYGDVLTLSFSAVYLRDRFSVDGTDISNGVLDLLRRTLFCPVTEDGVFSRAYTESEKSRLAEDIAAKINEKGAYARQRLYAEMFAGESGALPETGFAEDIEEQNAASLWEVYKSVILEAPVEIYCVGTADADTACLYKEKLFAGVCRNASEPRFMPPAVKTGVECRCVNEKMDITQGKLAIGYRAPCAIGSGSEYSDFLLACEVFGASPSSRLFMYVREKLNLCYYCGSVFRGTLASMFVYAGIDEANYDKACAAIEEMLRVTQNGEFTAEELEIAKKSLKAGIISGLDSPHYITAFFLSRQLCGVSDTPEDLTARIESASAADVAAAMRGARCDTVYFLSRGQKETAGAKGDAQ